MQVILDADGCPVVNITIKLCAQYGVACTIVCDTAHSFHNLDVPVITVDKGSDSADFAIANRIQAADIVITQDYGLASMCLAKKARVLHQDGWEYTTDNIDALLLQRHESRKLRNAGGRMKGPKKRQPSQDQAFLSAFEKLLQGYASGG